MRSVHRSGIKTRIGSHVDVVTDVPTLGLDENTTGALVEFAAGAHTLAKASITGTYARPS